MVKKQIARRGVGKTAASTSDNNEAAADEVVPVKKVATKGRPVPKGRGKSIQEPTEEDDVEDAADEDAADEEPANEVPTTAKGARKKVTFAASNSRAKGKGKAVMEAAEEERPESGDEDGADIDDDTAAASLERAVTLVTKPLRKQNLKPKEVKKENQKLSKVVATRREAGESSKKRKGAADCLELIKKRKEIDGHGSPRPLFNLIAVLTEAQKMDVEDIGFGGLLQLKTHAFLHQMADWLLGKYDPSSRMFLFNRHHQFVLTKDDVYDAFMLPCTEQAVDPRTDQTLALTWRKKFNINQGDEMPLDCLRQGMMGLPDGGAEFKKMFVLFAMGTFLAPTVHRNVDFRLVEAVDNVDSIRGLDWCSLVLQRLDTAVDSWRTHDCKNVGGCLMFLQMMYFHRLTWRGTPEKTSLPLLQHWSYERLKKRISEEVRAYQFHEGFGVGVWNYVTYPVSRDRVKCLYRRSNVRDPSSMAPPARFVTLPLPDGVPSDEDLLASYEDVRTRNWMTTRRNLSIVSTLHKTLLKAGAVGEGGASEQHGGSVGSVEGGGGSPTQGSFTQALGSPGFLAAWDSVGARLDAMIDVEMITAPSFSLGLDDILIPNQSTQPQPRPTRKKAGGSK